MNGNVILPFVDRFPTDTELYRIMTTRLSDLHDEDEKEGQLRLRYMRLLMQNTMPLRLLKKVIKSPKHRKNVRPKASLMYAASTMDSILLITVLDM